MEAPGDVQSVRGVLVHHPREVQRVRHRGLPVIPIEHALLHLALTSSTRRTLKALADAEYRGLLDPSSLQVVLGRGRRGSASLGAALDQHLPELAATRSELEQRFLLLCRAHGIPAPEVNVLVGRFLVDAIWRDRGVIVELDGRDRARPAA